jgi:hypothetical protein
MGSHVNNHVRRTHRSVNISRTDNAWSICMRMSSANLSKLDVQCITDSYVAELGPQWLNMSGYILRGILISCDIQVVIPVTSTSADKR